MKLNESEKSIKNVYWSTMKHKTTQKLHNMKELLILFYDLSLFAFKMKDVMM